MATCNVLRCTAEPVTVIATDRFGSRVEWAVCEDHRDRIDARETWRPDYEQRVILMRDDLRALDEYRFSGFTSARKIDQASDVDEPQYELRILGRRAVLRGNADDEHEYAMLISRKEMKVLAEQLDRASDS